MNEIEQQHYDRIDMPFYRNEIAPLLPERILDFHTHIWTRDVWKQVPWEKDVPGGKYMVTTQDYSIEDLVCDGKIMFPDRKFCAVCFGNPTPAADLEKTNDYTSQAHNHPDLYPLMVTGRDLMAPSQLEEDIVKNNFFGFKVFLNWFGNDYADLGIEDMIGPSEMELANKMHLVVLLHVPGDERLANKRIQDGVERLSKDYPCASVVLAHCGRCYVPSEAGKAMNFLKTLDNVYLDTSMVMDPTVIEIVLNEIAPERLLFATDLPVAKMRGRRVYVMDHWVDLVLEGYPPSQYRVCSNNMRATFMVYEIVLAIKHACDRTGLSQPLFQKMLYDNGMALLDRTVSARGF